MWLVVAAACGAKVGVGGVSSAANPFASRMVPGLHLCREPEGAWEMVFPSVVNGLELVRSRWENRMMLPFGADGNMTSWDSCGVVISGYWDRLVEALWDDNSYLRLYFDEAVERVPFTRGREIAQTIRIVVHPSWRAWRVEVLRFVAPTVGVHFALRFELAMDPSLEAEVGRESSAASNRLWYVGAGGVALVSLLLTICVGAFAREPEWKMGSTWPNCALFVGCGCGVVVYVCWSVWWSEFGGWETQKGAASACVVGAVVEALVGRLLFLRVDEVSLSAVFMGFFSCSWFGFDAANVLFGRHSFRGWGLRETFVENAWVLVAAAMASTGAGRLAGLLSWSDFRPPWNLKVVEHRRVVWLWFGERAFALVCGLALVPVVEHLFMVVFGDDQVDPGMICSSVLFFAALAWMAGVIRTFARIQLRAANWAFDHAGMALLSAAVPICFFIQRVVPAFRLSLQMLGFALACVVMIIGGTVAVGTFGGFLPSALAAHAAGRRYVNPSLLLKIGRTEEH